MDHIPQLLYVPKGGLEKRKRRLAIVTMILFFGLLAAGLWYMVQPEEPPEGAIRVDGGIGSLAFGHFKGD